MIENGKKINLEEMNVYIDDSGCKEETGSVFVGMDVEKIWSNIVIPYKSKECENYFMIRHNRIYTNVVLNKINDVNVMFAKVVMRAG